MEPETTLRLDATDAAGVYERALRPRAAAAERLLWAAWTLFGLGALVLLAWSAPGGAALYARLAAAGVPPRLLDWALVPAAMALRAVILVEVIGYVYHRFFQHVGWFTRRSVVFRRNQKYHWIHHMVIYPIGRLYRRALEYVAAEPGFAWSWIVPAILLGVAFVAAHGANLGSAVFLGGIALYAKGVIETVHERFHESEHPWVKSRYFNWLEEIHLLHHWDQRRNFTIVHPAMDWLFGTYLSPGTHRKELAAAMEELQLTVSDLINWRYLLIEATPAEYAAFISEARRHRPSLEKVRKLAALLDCRVEARPGDGEARLLQKRAQDLMRVLSAPAAAAA